MGKPYRIRRKVLDIGNSKAVSLPSDWKCINAEKVDIEVHDDKIIILPVK